MLKKWFPLTILSVMVTMGMAAPRAEADFFIKIETNFTSPLIINVGDIENESGNTDTIAPSITYVNSELSAAGFTFDENGLSLFSNRDLGGPEATLDFSGTVTYNKIGQSDGFIRITGVATDYTFPNGNRTFSPSGSDNMRTGVGSKTTLSSYYDPNNVGGVAGTGFASPVFTLGTTTPQSFDFNPGSAGVGNSSDPFALTIISESTLADKGKLIFGSQAVVTATAVPEPASIAMLLLGGSALSVRGMRRLKAKV